jgi:Mn2+/Fe2+ NRAMP family transporter
VWPRFELNASAAAVVVGIFGTTISPYLFFWQASEEVENMHATKGARALLHDPRSAPGELRRIRWDTWSGMFYSDVTAYFIILATAVTLHASGVKDIDTAAQAASALRPFAGDFAYILFALGILGVGRDLRRMRWPKHWVGSGAWSARSLTRKVSMRSLPSACSRHWAYSTCPSHP